jgi:hypothetical protein
VFKLNHGRQAVYDEKLDCYRIPLANGDDALVDKEDVDLLMCCGWSQSRKGYAVSATIMHRLIVRAKPGEAVDHINGNPLDNRKANLRICSASDNAKNRGKHKWMRSETCHSQFKGVSREKHQYKTFRKPQRQWTAHIRVGGTLKLLGRFVNEEDAARAYDAAARDHFGEFARTNADLGLI